MVWRWQETDMMVSIHAPVRERPPRAQGFFIDKALDHQDKT